MSGGFNLARWQPHLEAAEREGKTLKDYAQEHGISRHTLYGAKQTLRLQAGSRVSPAAQSGQGARQAPKSSFSAVRVAASPVRAVAKAEGRAAGPLRMRAELPNGVVVEWQCAAAEMGLMAKLIGMLGSLPCSG